MLQLCGRGGVMREIESKLWGRERRVMREIGREIWERRSGSNGRDRERVMGKRNGVMREIESKYRECR